MGQLRRLVRYGQMSEADAGRAGLRDAQAWYDALEVVGSILLVGLMVGLAWFIAVKGEVPEERLPGKQDRAAQVGTRFVMNSHDISVGHIGDR